MSDFPVEDAVEQRAPVVPEDDDGPPEAVRDDVDPADAYEQERVVPLDEDEWR